MNSPATSPCFPSATELHQAFVRGQQSASAIVESHLARVAGSNQQIRAIAIDLSRQARAAAAEADQQRRPDRSAGPLAGVPITVKECFHVAGTPHCLGIAGQRDLLAEQDGPLIQRLRHAGAVLIGKTNLSQLMLMQESDNPVYGRTLHPQTPSRSPGGSSGGEAAAIALGYAAAGLGTDIGGSIRQPAHSCGILGLKPTARRLPLSGIELFLPGMESLSLQPGPLARTAADLRRMMTALCDPTATGLIGEERPAPWRGQVDRSPRGLRIGYFTSDQYFRPSPAIARAVEQAANRLADRGAQLVPIQPPDARRGIQLYLSLFSADRCRTLARRLRGQPLDPHVKRLLALGRIPAWLRPLVAWGYRRLGDQKIAELVGGLRPGGVPRYWELTCERNRFAEEHLAAWRSQRLDAVICPPHGLPALTHGSFADVTPAASYAFLGNLLGVPAGVVPFTRVRPDEQHVERGTDPTSRAAQRVDADSAGLPIGVQVLGLPWEDERVVDLMDALHASGEFAADASHGDSVHAAGGFTAPTDPPGTTPSSPSSQLHVCC